MFKVLVLGGYGLFGRRLVSRWTGDPSLHVVVAGRSLPAARAAVLALRDGARARFEAVALDGSRPSFGDALRELSPDVLVDASGPFQGGDHRVPLACIAAGVHHVDLADARDRVVGIASLDDAAKSAGVAVLSGASTVPALSSAVADRLSSDLAVVGEIDIGISPGNRTERGLSTVRSILGYCGKPIVSDGTHGTFGWTGTRRHDYPAPVGTRLLSPCDVPDLTLFPARYPGGPRIRFGAGLELQVLHRSLNAMAWMTRVGLVPDWTRHAKPLWRLADRFRGLGSDAGAMHVTVRGTDRRGERVSRTWYLVATDGHGPFVPTLAAAALVRKFRRAPPVPGAAPCVGWLALADFEAEMAGLSIRTEVRG